jgi:hypothetical protein
MLVGSHAAHAVRSTLFPSGAWLSPTRADEARAAFGRSLERDDISVPSAQVPVTFVDYRPLPVALSGVSSVGGDLGKLSFADPASIPSE